MGNSPKIGNGSTICRYFSGSTLCTILKKIENLGSTILAGCYFLSFYLILVARFLVLKAGQEPKAESLEVNHQHILPGSWAKTGNLVENPSPRALSSIRSIFWCNFSPNNIFCIKIAKEIGTLVLKKPHFTRNNGHFHQRMSPLGSDSQEAPLRPSPSSDGLGKRWGLPGVLWKNPDRSYICLESILH